MNFDKNINENGITFHDLIYRPPYVKINGKWDLSDPQKEIINKIKIASELIENEISIIFE